jgi:glycine/D-amino acid oxidase-like deaminating enzyme
VTLLEAEDALAYHASGRSAAMFIEDYGNACVRALNTASADHHHHADGGVLSPRAMMMLAKSDESEAFATETASLGLSRISIPEAQALVPILDPATCAFAALRNDIFDLDTDLLIQGFLRTARSHGATIITRARVTSITRDAGNWLVTSGDQTYRATTLINAAGAWADPIAIMAGVAPLAITPYRRSMARIPVPGGHDPAKWPFMDGVNEGWYAKPDAGALIVSPADEVAVDPHDAWADDMTLAEGLARFEELITEPITRMLANWAGLRSFAPDRTLVIGRDPVIPDFVWLAGQGGYGFQTAPAASQLVADLLTGAPSTLDKATINALKPNRFF